MTLQAFRRVQPKGEAPTSREFVEAQLQLERIINGIVGKPFLDGLYLRDVALELGYENWVEHGLGRKYQSYWLCRPQGVVGYMTSSTSTADPALYVPITVTVACTVDLVVF